MFTRNQYAALFHDVGGKTPGIGCRQHGIQTRVIQYRRTGFFIGLLSRGLACQQTQLAVCLTPRNTEKAELLDAMQRSPGIDIFGIVPQ
ncbi:Uncharacterised protein [Klebsiella pneumoniae]|nr:Uncharacterised protein [Klebsiella pneumoniae]